MATVEVYKSVGVGITRIISVGVNGAAKPPCTSHARPLLHCRQCQMPPHPRVAQHPHSSAMSPSFLLVAFHVFFSFCTCRQVSDAIPIPGLLSSLAPTVAAARSASPPPFSLPDARQILSAVAQVMGKETGGGARVGVNGFQGQSHI